MDRADIFIEGPEGESGDSAQDSGDEEFGTIDSLSGKQLDTVADLIIVKHGIKERMSQDEEDNTSTSDCDHSDFEGM